MNISAAEFKAKCLKLIDEVATSHVPLIITKQGKPGAKLAPIDEETPKSLFGYMRGKGQILGDIVNVPQEPWTAETGEEDDLYAGLTPSRATAIHDQ
jgi:prevent-host-death family protein